MLVGHNSIDLVVEESLPVAQLAGLQVIRVVQHFCSSKNLDFSLKFK